MFMVCWLEALYQQHTEVLKVVGGTEGWRNPICRAVIRKIGRQEINEWTMSQ